MSLLKDTRPFLLAQLCFVLIAGSLILIFDKKELHLLTNQAHFAAADAFFKYVTKLAEGLAIGGAVFILLLYRIRYGIMTLICTTGAGLVTQFLKRIVFNDHHRPVKVFEGIHDLHLIDGVAMHKAFSFPSGHSTAAFALFLCIAVIAKKPVWQLLCFLLALITAFSRVYLSQHFMQDILVGSLVGSGFSLLVVWILKDQKWGEQGLLSSFDFNRKQSP